MVTEILKRQAGFFDSFETKKIRDLNKYTRRRTVLLEGEDGCLRSQWDVFRELRDHSTFMVGYDVIGRSHVVGIMPLVRSRQANRLHHYPVEQAGVVSKARTALWLAANLAALDQGLLKEGDILNEYSDPKRGIKPTTSDGLRGWLGSLVTELHENRVSVIKAKRGTNPRKTYYTPQLPEGYTGNGAFVNQPPAAEVIQVTIQPLTKKERREGLVRLATRTGPVVVLAATACAILPEAIKTATAVPPTPVIKIDLATATATRLPTATQKLDVTATPFPTEILSSVPEYPDVDELPEISTNGGSYFAWGTEIKADDPNPENAQLFNQISQAAYEGLSAQYPDIDFDIHLKVSQAGYQVWAVGTDGRLYGEREVSVGPDGKALRDESGKLIYGNVKEVAVLSLLGRPQLEAMGLSNGHNDVKWGQYPPVPIPDGIDPNEVEFNYASIKAKNGDQWIARLVAQARGVAYAVYDAVNNFWTFAKGSGIAAGGAIVGAPDIFASPAWTPMPTPTETATAIPFPTPEFPVPAWFGGGEVDINTNGVVGGFTDPINGPGIFYNEIVKILASQQGISVDEMQGRLDQTGGKSAIVLLKAMTSSPDVNTVFKPPVARKDAFVDLSRGVIIRSVGIDEQTVGAKISFGQAYSMEYQRAIWFSIGVTDQGQLVIELPSKFFEFNDLNKALQNPNFSNQYGSGKIGSPIVMVMEALAQLKPGVLIEPESASPSKGVYLKTVWKLDADGILRPDVIDEDSFYTYDLSSGQITFSLFSLQPASP